MNYKLGILTYLPDKVGNPDSFLQNVKDFPPENAHIIYTDTLERPTVKLVKLGGNLEMARTTKNKMAIPNLSFLVGVRIAASHGFTHIMPLEEDCRWNVAGFDEIIWQEFLSKNAEAIVGGSIVCFNPCAWNRKAALAYQQLIVDNHHLREIPFSMTGSSNLAEKTDSCVFPNGALGIFRVDWLLKQFPECTQETNKYLAVAQGMRAWDYEIGIRLWKDFQEGVYDRVVQLNKIYSGYGNILSTEEERRELLAKGKVVAIHQVKSNWVPEKLVMPDLAPVETKFVISPDSVLKQPISNVITIKDYSEETKPSVGIYPKTEIFIVTYANDFAYLELCLRSIKKFCTGFSGVTILVPNEDFLGATTLANKIIPKSVTIRSGREWKDKGMLWHMAQKCRAEEWCPDAEYIAHFDSDCIFHSPVNPGTFFKDGVPVLRYEPFESLAKREPNIWNWKIAAENCLPFQVNDEGMRGHPEVYHASTYPMTRLYVEQKTGLKFDNYVRSQKNKFPQTFCEFVTLSAVALEFQRDKYHPMDASKQENPDLSPWPVHQFWSHSPVDKDNPTWIDGKKQTIVPLTFANEILK